MVCSMEKMTKNDIKTAFFREFTNFSQHVLTQYVTSADMVLGTWTELSVSFPNIMDRTPILASGTKKTPSFRHVVCCRNNHLQMSLSEKGFALKFACFFLYQANLSHNFRSNEKFFATKNCV